MLHLFTAHPHSVGESYGEHFCFASRFGLRMLAGGLAAVVHGLLPFLFETTGSRTILAAISARTSPSPRPAASLIEILLCS